MGSNLQLIGPTSFHDRQQNKIGTGQIIVCWAVLIDLWEPTRTAIQCVMLEDYPMLTLGASENAGNAP